MRPICRQLRREGYGTVANDADFHFVVGVFSISETVLPGSQATAWYERPVQGAMPQPSVGQTFNEDRPRLRAGHGAKNMAVARFALNPRAPTCRQPIYELGFQMPARLTGAATTLTSTPWPAQCTIGDFEVCGCCQRSERADVSWRWILAWGCRVCHTRPRPLLRYLKSRRAGASDVILGSQCPFRNFLNRVNRLDSKEVA